MDVIKRFFSGIDKAIETVDNMNTHEVYPRCVEISTTYGLRPPIVNTAGTKKFSGKPLEKTEISFIKELDGSSWNSGIVILIDLDDTTGTAELRKVRYRDEINQNLVNDYTIQTLVKNILKELNR